MHTIILPDQSVLEIPGPPTQNSRCSILTSLYVTGVILYSIHTHHISIKLLSEAKFRI